MVTFDPNNDLKTTPMLFNVSFDNLVILGCIGVAGVALHAMLDNDLGMHLEYPIAGVFGTATIGGYFGFRYIEHKFEPSWLSKVLASLNTPKKIKGVYLKEKILKK